MTNPKSALRKGTPNIEPIYPFLGLKIKHMRETLGIEQAELARRLGQTRASISNLETGKQRIPLHAVENIAKAFGIAPRHLLKGIWT